MARFAQVVLTGVLACLLPFSAALAQDEQAVHNILQRIQEAARTLNYEGTFAYQQNGQMQAFRIVHRYQDGDEQERLEVLDNEQREFLRRNEVVHCLMPERQTVLIESRRQARFPALLIAGDADLAQHYELRRLPVSGRVAGRACSNFEIVPKDHLRPHFRLCADDLTGLLLKAQVLESSGRVSQQVAFTQVQIGMEIPEEAFKPSWNTENWAVLNREPQVIDLNALGWKYDVPDGYQVSMQARRQFQDGREVDQAILTDGLASISIFIEPYQEKLSQHHSTGPRHIGSVNLYGKRVGDFWVMIVGEVPAPTVQIIADTIHQTADSSDRPRLQP